VSTSSSLATLRALLDDRTLVSSLYRWRAGGGAGPNCTAMPTGSIYVQLRNVLATVIRMYPSTGESYVEHRVSDV